MSFPKLKSKVYTITLPISKREVTYRPYTVNEENPLLEARAKEDEVEYSKAMAQVVSTCSFGKIDSTKDSYIDVIYAFMMIRAKSVDEVANFEIKCECEKSVPVSVDLTRDLKITYKDQDNKINIDNDGQILTLVMQNLTFDTFIKSSVESEKILSDFSIFRGCLHSIIEGDEVYDIRDSTDEEWEEFFLSIPKNVYVKISRFLENEPEVFLEVNATCECGKHIKREIKGTENFI